MGRILSAVLSGVAIMGALVGGFANRGVGSTSLSTQAGGRPTSTAAHTYFDALSARPDRVHAYSLRDQAQLNQYVHGRRPSDSITFDPANDGYVLHQDAAKVVVAANASTIKGVRLPIETGAGKTLITWDAWWGPEFSMHRGAMQTQKTFQIASPLDNSQRWLEIRTRFSEARSPNICTIDMRSYARLGPSTAVGRMGATTPQRAQFQVAPATWTRFWVEVEINPDTWDRVSLWVADEKRDPVQLLDRLEIESAGRLTNFWLEFNSSQHRAGGPLTGYIRNVVVLRNVEDSASVLQRPGR